MGPRPPRSMWTPFPAPNPREAPRGSESIPSASSQRLGAPGRPQPSHAGQARQPRLLLPRPPASPPAPKRHRRRLSSGIPPPPPRSLARSLAPAREAAPRFPTAFAGRRSHLLPGRTGAGSFGPPRKWRARRGSAHAQGGRKAPAGIRSPRSAMAAPVLLLLLLLAGAEAEAEAGGGGLYSREANEAASPSAEFRLVRLNQLWEKAQRVGLPAVRLAELHSDLRLQEKDELSWKKLKAAGLDEDGEREARLRRRLEVIMTKYGLSGKKEGQQWETNHIKEDFAQDGLGDPRLEKLWNKAKSSGKFSDEELEKLWREFQHHKEKVHEYNILLETMSRTEDVHKNTIDRPAEEESAARKELLHRKHSELKEQLHSINQGFERLRKVSYQGYDSASEFEEPRVIDLWDLAQSTNFTEKELESLREELKHFEAKVEKHHHYQKQLEISHQKLKHVEGTGDKEHLGRNKEKYAMLEEKTKELGYKVKKHLQDLSSRISRGLQHNEL